VAVAVPALLVIVVLLPQPVAVAAVLPALDMR
jgi:hypothetical protein